MTTVNKIVSVLTPAQDQNLTTLATVKEELDIPVPDTSQDTRLNRLIAAASSRLGRKMNRETMGKERVLEKTPGFGELSLMLSRVPIIGAIEKIEIRGAVITDFEIEDREAGFLFRENGWTWEPDIASFAIATAIVPRSENPNYEVTYSGGFFLPDHAGKIADDIVLHPEIEQAAILTVQDWFRARTVDRNVTQYRAADVGLTFATGANRMGIPIEALELIEPFIHLD